MKGRQSAESIAVRGQPIPAYLSDAELLDRFVSFRDEAAFAALVARHGPMVFGVCRRLLRHAQDAEDAFQATFLVFVRKAAAIGRRELLGNWLYGVASRVAARARRTAARRHTRETTDMERIAVATREAAEPANLPGTIEEEVLRLPAKYRGPIVLCYLEGRTNEEAAGELRWPVGTVKGRLARAREMLRKRLARRGLALSTAALAAALSPEALAAPLPPALIDSTAQAAMYFYLAAGDAARAGLVSAQAAALAKGVLHTMFVTKMKTLAVLVLTLAAIVGGVGGFAYHFAKEADAKKTDKDNIQGKWAVVSLEQNGKERDDEEAKTIKSFKWDIGAEKITIHQGGSEHVSSYKLDPSAKPKALDLTSEEEAEKGLTIAAVYELKGDTLKICSPVPGNDPSRRPKEVATKEGSGTMLIVLKRVKK